MGLNSQTFRSRGCSWTCLVRFCALIHRFYPFFSCSLDLSKLLLSLCAGVFAVLMGSRGTDFRSQSFFNATLTALTLRAESTISSSNAAMQGQGGQLMTNNLSPEMVALITNTVQAGKCRATRPEFLIRHWSCPERSFAVHRANFGKCFICTVHANLLSL